jgi:hypothetical protein
MSYPCGKIYFMTTLSPKGPPTRNLVYGHAQMHDCLAFDDANTAADEAQEIVAIATSRTWGEARRVAPRHTWNPVGPEYHDPEDGPADDEPFDINKVGLVQQGDWPDMVTSRALKLLPKDLQARFGVDADTVLNGDYLEIPLDREAELVAELRERGFEVSRDDELINVLDGRGFSPLV